MNKHASDFPNDGLRIRARIEQTMGQKWMEPRQKLTLSALFDAFLLDYRPRWSVPNKVCPECARHGHTGEPATKDRHSEQIGTGDCS